MPSIAEHVRPVTGGVDIHAEVHVAAVVDQVGRVLGTETFSATPPGYQAVLAWMGGFGELGTVGIEGTGSYGAGLARHLAAQGSPWWRSSAPTGRLGAGVASPTRPTRSPPRWPRSTGRPRAPRSPMPSRPGMATSCEAHSAAASFEDGSIARFATSANSTRSTSVVNRRPPSTVRNAVSTSRACHSPCSSHAAPTGERRSTAARRPRCRRPPTRLRRCRHRVRRGSG